MDRELPAPAHRPLPEGQAAVNLATTVHCLSAGWPVTERDTFARPTRDAAGRIPAAIAHGRESADRDDRGAALNAAAGALARLASLLLPARGRESRRPTTSRHC